MFKIYFIFFILFNSIFVNAQESLRSDLKRLGANYSATITQRTDNWIRGSTQIPSFQTSIEAQINSAILNTQVPGEIDVQQVVADNPKRVSQILGINSQVRNSFKSLLSKIVIDSTIAGEYNYFLTESNKNGCWQYDLSRKAECAKLIDLGVGIYLALYENQNVLGSAEIPIDKMATALGKFLVAQKIDPKLEIGLHSMNFAINPDPNTLWNLGYRINEQSAVFRNFDQGELNAIDAERFKKREDGAYKNLFVNQFRNSVDTLQTILNDRRRGWDLASRTAKRIESLKTPLVDIIHWDSNKTFSVKELYSGLGVLHQYYELQAEFILLDKLRKFRGDLRTEFAELTESWWERQFLWLWGGLSAYGTSIAGLTITFAVLVVGLLSLSLISSHKNGFLHGLQVYLRILTIRGEKEDLWGLHWLVLAIEAFVFVFMPTYLGFLITFLLRAG